MRYRRLGQWGITVSEITLGTWLTHGGRAGEDTALACTRRAYECGVTVFDTANVYPEGNEGAAERVLGKALAPFPRDTFLVATKVFSPMGDGPLQRGLSRKHITEQINQSLHRLSVDYVDLYQCHRYDPETPLEETASVMNDLVHQGKILYWGVSDWSADHIDDAVTLCRARNWAVPVSNQPYYSLLRRNHEERELPTCQKWGMGVLAYAPLEHGVLAGKYEPGRRPPAGSRADGPDVWMFDHHFTADVLRAVQDFRILATESGFTPAQLALAWCLRHDVVSSVIVGASTLAQLEENVAVTELDIAVEILDKAENVLHPVRLT